MISSVITLIYYALVAYITVILAYNLIKSRSWEREILYIVVLIPFLLRLFRLK
jgi:ABC-type spermidine/putrescine transport system permease subunit I